jgi:putative acetyltransferase
MQQRINPITIRPIAARDNKALASLIRQVLIEFDANKPGTAFFDKTLDTLSDVFREAGSGYWVAEENGVLLGGGGIYPTEGLPEGYCELVKLYVHAHARGKGIGKKLLNACFLSAQLAGYTHMYLETIPVLSNAISVYEKLGFTYLAHPLGNSGHHYCSVRMVRKL